MQPKNQDEHTQAIIQAINDTSAMFQRVFKGKDGEGVLTELERIIPHDSPFDKDPNQHAFNAGKTAVWDYIQNALDEKRVRRNIERYKKTLSKEKKNV